MIQHRILMTLALLLTAVTGAWAQSYEAKVFDVPASWEEDNTKLSAADLPKDFVQITEDEAKALAVPDGNVLLIYGFNGNNVKMMQFNSGTAIIDEEDDDEGAPEARGNFLVFQTNFNAKICYPAPAGPKVAWDPATKTGTFTMPAFDVELTPIYAPEFTAAFKAGNSNTIQGSKATVSVTESDGTTAYTGATLDENGNYKPLYEEQKITLTAKPGYKFKGVEVKKGPAIKTITIEDVVLVYEDGDTWEKIKDRNPGKVVCNTYVFIKGSVVLLNGPVSQTDVIVPDGAYTLGAT